ncbi:MAG: NAD(P)-binding protein [Nanoarchaeota archaeon]|nr:NAD(P)-binding protein [Nanoarchaeota archaeon]MBU4300314.1 NAD(P)-binding protein [Nanoarchaeota archaeon]MBU4452039.1 NAD(P)-binding protein [Nanoarchaeota archaeon]MCG2723179.1 NAD(P)-binding protein [archaeon]
MIKILGAGLSGLSAAINLAKAGKEVEVHELKSDVGMHIKTNFQALLSDSAPEDYLRNLNLNPEFFYHSLSNVLFCTRKKEFDLKIQKSIPFVCRGGKQSLEYGLFKEAEKVGVRFVFKTTKRERDVDIIATGHKNADIAAFGAVYKDNGFLGERFLMMYDDKYSPKGWYLYATPHLKGYVKIMNCVLKPHTPKVKDLFFKAINEREILKKIVGGQKPVDYLGGIGGLDFPINGVIGGKYYLGEAAGFQDPFRGFGMNYALESGKLVADAILQNKDYNKLWKEAFMPHIKKDFSRRFIMSVFGDMFVENVFSKRIRNGVVDFESFAPAGFFGRIAIDFFFRMELLRHKITGYW